MRWSEALGAARESAGRTVSTSIASLREAPRTYISGGAQINAGGALPTKHQVAVRDTRLHSVVMACQQYYMRKISEAPLRAVSRDGLPLRGGARIAADEINNLLMDMNRFDDWRTVAGSLFWDTHSLGDGFLWRDFSEGLVRGYWWLPNAKVGVYQGLRADEVKYRYMGREYGPDEIVHLRNYKSADNPARGVGVLHTLVGEVYIDEQARRYAASLLANDGRPSGLMTVSGRAGEYEREAAGRMLMENYGGDNAGKIAVVNNADGVDFVRINMTPAEFDFSALVKISESRVPGVLGIPASQINMYTGMETGTTNATREQDRFQVEQDLFVPSWESFESQLTKLIVPDWTADPNVCLKFDLENVPAVQKMAREREVRAIELFKNAGLSMLEYHRLTGAEIEPADEDKLGQMYVLGEGKNMRVATIDALWEDAQMSLAERNELASQSDFGEDQSQGPQDQGGDGVEGKA